MTHHAIQTEVAKLIKACPWFARHGYDPVCEASGILDEELETRLLSAEGCVILISCGSFEPQSTDSEAVPGTLDIRCAVAEHPPTNRARTEWATASQAAEHLAAHLNLKPVCGEHLYGPAIRPEPSEDMLQHTVTLKLNHVLEAPPSTKKGSRR